MSKNEFIQGLEAALSGNVPPETVRENLIYYRDYIRTEQEKGRTEQDIMDELGDPRLIARTIMDTTPGAEEGAFEPYHFRGFFSEGSQSGSYSQSGGSYNQDGSYSQNEGYGQGNSSRGHIHYYNLDKWYWKLLAVVVVVLFFMLLFTLITGFLSLVIPMLPVRGLIAGIRWFVGGRRR